MAEAWANNPERVKALVAITQRGHGKALVQLMSKKGVGYNMTCRGLGTASSEMMDILGLGSIDKDIVISFGKQSAVEEVVREFSDSLSPVRTGRGIMMLISPDAVGSLIATILTRVKSEATAASSSGDREGADIMKNEHRHSLILIAVNQGYTDQVMQTARKAGATGGTIIKARLAADELSETFRGISFDSEKEIVVILAPDSIKENLMNDVNSEHGLRTEAQGVICSVPVDKAFKI